MRHALLLLLLLLGLPAAAQPVLGVKGGLNVANINGSYGYFSPRVGFHAGVFAASNPAKRLSLQAEVLYSQKGFRSYVTIEPPTGSSYSARFRFYTEHLDIPLVLNCRVLNRFTPYVGPQASVLIRRNAGVQGFRTDYATYSGGSRLLVGAVAGLGFRITNRLGADVRYSRDLIGSGFRNHALQAGMSFALLAKNDK